MEKKKVPPQFCCYSFFGIISMVGLLIAPRWYPMFVARFGLAYTLWRHDPFTGGPSILLLAPEDAWKALTHPSGERAPKTRHELGKLLGQSFGVLEGSEHKAQREVLRRVLSPKNLEKLVPEMTPGINWIAEELERHARDGMVISNAATLVSLGMLRVFGRIIFGVKNLERFQKLNTPFRRCLATIYERIMRPPLPAWLAKGLWWWQDSEFSQDLVFIQSEVQSIIDRPEDILSSSLLGFLLLEGYSKELLRDTMVAMFVAAFDATVNSTVGGWVILGDYPEVVAQMRREAVGLLENPSHSELERLHFIEKVNEELRRLFVPAHLNERYFPHGANINGWELPPGTRVIMSPHITQRLESVWGPDATELRPDRPANQHARLGFGGGAHWCLGAPFAKLFQRYLAAEIARRGLEVSLAPGSRLRYQVKLLTVITSARFVVRHMVQ